MAEEVSPPEDDEVASLIGERIISLLPWAGFFMIIFGVPLAFDPDRVNWHWLGWLLSLIGVILLGGTIISMIIKSRRKKSGYNYVLSNGRVVSATVKEHLVYDGIVREMKFHKPILEDGAMVFDRQWVMQSHITITIEEKEIKFTIFRPEIIGVFDKGAKVPVLWHPKRPGLFIPVEN